MTKNDVGDGMFSFGKFLCICNVRRCLPTVLWSGVWSTVKSWSWWRTHGRYILASNVCLFYSNDISQCIAEIFMLSLLVVCLRK